MVKQKVIEEESRTQRLVEKYRPQKIDDIVGNDPIKLQIKSMLSRHLPHMMFVGPPGTGKTTMAHAIANEKYGEHSSEYLVEINASDERGIGTIRGRVKQLSQILGERIVYLGESDSLTPEAQDALRRPMETTEGTTFILSGNHEDGFSEAIKSRCVIFHFKPLSTNEIFGRLAFICASEGINFEVSEESDRGEIVQGLEYLARSSGGDLRSAINTLERLITSGKNISVKEIKYVERPSEATEALKTALSGNFLRAREMMEECYINNGMGHLKIIKELYDSLQSLTPTEISDNVKIRLYIKIAETEARLKNGSDGIIQLTGLLASAWLYPNLSPSLPPTSQIV